MKKKKKTAAKIYVELTAVWGNDDAESTIKMSRRRWKRIEEGAEYRTSAWSWYEGTREAVRWCFANREVSIGGEDGATYWVDMPLEELIVQGDTTGND